MSKYQEALEKLINYLPKKEFMSWGRDCEMLLQELVDKEMPMKPIRKGKLNWWHCQKCDKLINFGNQLRCQTCGQKIDWGDSDDNRS